MDQTSHLISSGKKTYGAVCNSTELSLGSVVAFQNINYTVNVSSGCCKTQPKSILKNVSGIFKPGTLNVIMGATGSGKSTLLDILAGRKNPAGLSGTVLIDGRSQPADFRLRSGYVVQDDVVMSTLTVKENLQFSADLRLPKYLRQEEKTLRVERVINQLALDKCADTRIGDQFRRGVSGGERKRCNIGMELITSPRVLFLDEPTTGLDANTAHTVITLLKGLAYSGSTVILSIHQPRYSIFKLCDTVMLLAEGRTIYQGPALEGLDFFKSCGFMIEEHDNPADFFLDVLSGGVSSVKDSDGVLPQENSHTNVINIIDEMGETVSVQRCNQLSSAFLASQWFQKVEAELSSYMSEYDNQPHISGSQDSPLTYHAHFFKQFAVLCKRSFKNLMRNPRTGIMQWFITVFFGIIVGGIYFQLKKDCNPGIQDRVGAFFFIVMNQIFANMSAIDLFITERAIFMHENVSGYYRVSAFFFAKVFCDLLPFRTVPALIFGSITYLMMGLVAKWQSFLIYLVTIVVTSWSATFVAFAASASTRQQAIASLIVALVYVIQMVFSGLLVNLKYLAEWLRWLKYVSIFNFSMTALQINEFKEIDFYVDPPNNTISCVKGTAESYLEKQGIAYSTEWDLWINVLALGAITVFFMLVAYIQLRRVEKLK